MSYESAEADRFWVHAEHYLELPGVSRSRMMGLPCLRIRGRFFASFDRRTGDLLVKLDADRIEQLLDPATRSPSPQPADDSESGRPLLLLANQRGRTFSTRRSTSSSIHEAC